MSGDTDISKSWSRATPGVSLPAGGVGALTPSSQLGHPGEIAALDEKQEPSPTTLSGT
jgi:hypothetical protein